MVYKHLVVHVRKNIEKLIIRNIIDNGLMTILKREENITNNGRKPILKKSGIIIRNIEKTISKREESLLEYLVINGRKPILECVELILLKDEQQSWKELQVGLI